MLVCIDWCGTGEQMMSGEGGMVVQIRPKRCRRLVLKAA